MVKALRVEGLGVVRVCEVCGLGYEGREDAEACEAHCRAHPSCDLAIARRSVYRPGG
ncbi:MAG TPA: hypothetical protein VGR28_00275 [Candidatus Thermoplasmatota archaeon]|jgi:hypothetical protein|nr:hypothetical protein [Candidatus Thermoplasmatota archaeon]